MFAWIDKVRGRERKGSMEIDTEGQSRAQLAALIFSSAHRE